MPESHCWVHHVDERIGARTYRVCFECGHVFTRRSLRRAFRREVLDMARHPLQPPFGPPPSRWRELAGVLRLWFRRPSRIWSCPECIHDF